MIKYFILEHDTKTLIITENKKVEKHLVKKNGYIKIGDDIKIVDNLIIKDLYNVAELQSHGIMIYNPVNFKEINLILRNCLISDFLFASFYKENLAKEYLIDTYILK